MEKILYNPLSENDNKIYDYIKNYTADDYTNIIKNDGSFEVIKHLSMLSRGIINWYPFKSNSNILQINGEFGNISLQLLNYCYNLTIIEKNLFRLECIKERLKDFKNIRFSDKIINDKYDYIIYIADENSEPIIDTNFLKQSKSMLKNDGKLLFTVYNAIGTRFLCGESAENCLPFETVEKSNKNYLLQSEAEKMIKNSGFINYKIYYPFPDHITPQLIYTKNYPPDKEISERLNIYNRNSSMRIISENRLILRLAEEKNIFSFANSFLFECSDADCCDVTYAALSSNRSKERAFATVIREKKVEKIPVYADEKSGINTLYKNCAELKARNIPVIDLQITENKIIMNKILYPTLSTALRTIFKNREKFTKIIDKLYEYILNSSEHIDKSENYMLHYAPDEEWGVILKKAYIEMIPVNSFYKDNGELLFFDQEYTKENCPALYVLFRGIRDIYNFIPETSEYISLEFIKERYKLSKLWNYFEKEEFKFGYGLTQYDIYRNFINKYSENEKLILNNRRILKMNAEKHYKLLNPISELENEKIILFGSGRYCDYYMDKYGKKYPPVLIIDNNSDRWGQIKYNVPIKSPEAVKEFIYGTYRIIVTIADYFPITEQLNSMGINEKYYRVYHKDVDNMLNLSITDTMSEGKYNIGYVTGAFDLFHIGHLNILKRSKERCHYLIAGVLTDEIIIDEKYKQPFIPFEERIEIVRQCRLVDRVIAIDKHNTDKIEAWKELKFGCLFAGSDHLEEGWFHLRNQLIALGSNLEFFPYTQSTSSTMLQKAIKEFDKE